jgi:hypothetical protein
LSSTALSGSSSERNVRTSSRNVVSAISAMTSGKLPKTASAVVEHRRPRPRHADDAVDLLRRLAHPLDHAGRRDVDQLVLGTTDTSAVPSRCQVGSSAATANATPSTPRPLGDLAGPGRRVLAAHQDLERRDDARPARRRRAAARAR